MTDLAIIALAVVAGIEGVAVALLVIGRHRSTQDLNALIGLVDRLCQRIQAPSAAVLEHHEQARPLRDEEYAPAAVNPEDDDAYWMSRERLADQLMAQETADGGH